jgi:hypothetical protein
MKLDWMLLANYAEDNRGLLNITGAGWDTIEARGPVTANAPLRPGIEMPKAVIAGFLVARLLFHASETGRELSFRVVILDADGGEVARAEGKARIEKTANLPGGWLQASNVIVPLSGVPLPKFGQYSVALLVDDQHVGDLSFRVVKQY